LRLQTWNLQLGTCNLRRQAFGSSLIIPNSSLKEKTPPDTSVSSAACFG
jgi:hypothetical protein